jgi:hypothetical protein
MVIHSRCKHPNDIKKTWLECEICQQCCIDSSALMRHTAKIHPIQNGNRIKCSFCIETFTQRSKMATHCRRKHQNDIKKTWLQCEQCQQYSIDSSTLKIHTDRKHPLLNCNRTKCLFNSSQCDAKSASEVIENIDIKDEISDSEGHYYPDDKSLRKHEFFNQNIDIKYETIGHDQGDVIGAVHVSTNPTGNK